MPRKNWGRRIPAVEDSYEDKRRLALETAARAFNERGFYRTSLDDIAAELNVTKAALYYYFESKDEILYECHAAAIRSLTDTPLDGDDRHLTGLEKIERLVRRYVPMIVQSFGRCLVLVGTQPLEPPNARKCRAGRRGINDLVVGLIREGIADGSIAPCDPKLASYFIFGTLNWIAQWYREDGPRSLETIADEIVGYVCGGLARKGKKAHRSNEADRKRGIRRISAKPKRAARVLGMLLVSSALAIGGIAHAGGAPATGEDAYAFLQEYVDLGLHRTGTAGNAAVTSWLSETFSGFGLATSTQSFPFPQFVPGQVSLTVGSFSPAVFPLYYYGRTDAGGVTAELVDAGLGTPVDLALHPVAGKIALVEVPMPLSGAVPTLGRALTAASQAGAVALIAAVDAPLNQISVPDVDARAGFCALPVLIVGKHDGEELRRRAGQAATVVLEADVRDGGASALGVADNVIGVIPGASDDVLVVGTPITGWFAAATERGAGIGTLVTLARYFAARYATERPAQTLLFLGTSGHEVGFLGLEKLLDANPELVPRISAYLHLGAGVSAKQYVAVGDQIVETGINEPLRLITVSENPILAPIVLSTAARDGVLPMVPAPQGVGASGEEVFLYVGGVPVVAVKSPHLWIHTPRDLPDGTSAALLDPVVRMYRDLVEALLAEDPATLRAANPAADAIAPFTSDVLKGVGIIRCTP